MKKICTTKMMTLIILLLNYGLALRELREFRDDETCEDEPCEDEPCEDEPCDDPCEDEPCDDPCEPCEDEPCEDEPCDTFAVLKLPKEAFIFVLIIVVNFSIVYTFVAPTGIIFKF